MAGLSLGQIWNPQWQFMEENKIFGIFLRQLTFLLPSTGTVLPHPEHAGTERWHCRCHTWAALVTAAGWVSSASSAQLVQMVLTTQQHDKGTSEELSHSVQWGCNLGWGDVGGDTAWLCLIKINSGEIKKTKKYFNLKRGRNRQIKGMNFSSKTDC